MSRGLVSGIPDINWVIPIIISGLNGKNNKNINEITPTIYYYYLDYLDQFHKELLVTLIHDISLFTLSADYEEEQEHSALTLCAGRNLTIICLNIALHPLCTFLHRVGFTQSAW